MKRFISGLFAIILFELALGGGGRLTAWGPISLRMILFTLAMSVIGIQIVRQVKIANQYWFLLTLFGIILTIGLARGISLGASRVFWWEDIKPLMYFFILPFFAFALREGERVEQAAQIVIRSGIILSCLFIIILILIHTGIFPFLTFYHTVIGTEEFFFRGELTFFYKGFIYICLALFFVHFGGVRGKKAVMFLLITGILLSVTRGFLFAILLTYACYYLIKSPQVKRMTWIKVLISVSLALTVVLAGQFLISKSSETINSLSELGTPDSPETKPNSNLFGNKNYSDEGRLQQINEVAERIDLASFFVGHGFGNGIPSRPIHMEISYLEIFHKQGLLGLAFWFYFLMLLYQKYKSASPGSLRDSYFFTALFIYFQSLTNQFMNNPIGLSILLLSFVCLDQLKGISDKTS